jgi:hypothetical protein
VGGACGTNGKERKVCKVLLEKLEGKRPLVRPRSRWEDGIRMDFEEFGLGVWSEFSWLRIEPVADFCEFGNEPSVYGPTDL